MTQYAVRRRHVSRTQRTIIDVQPGPAPDDTWRTINAESETGARLAFVTAAKAGRFDYQHWTRE